MGVKKSDQTRAILRHFGIMQNGVNEAVVGTYRYPPPFPTSVYS